MTLLDEHLEQALGEYNLKISELEDKGDKKGLVGALAFRSTILMLMESYVSCVSDVDEALELCRELEAEGKNVNPGIRIKLYENRGLVFCDSKPEQMVADYTEILKILDNAKGNLTHYPRKELVTMIVDCASDLKDKEKYALSAQFAEKAIEVIGRSNNAYEMNLLLETYNLIGEIKNELKDYDAAISNFEEAVGVAEVLGDRIEDMSILACIYVNLGNVYQTLNRKDKMMENDGKAIEILNRIYDGGQMVDKDVLLELHQTLATTLLEKGDVEEAEKHLVEAMKLGIPNIEEAIKKIDKGKNH